MTANNRNVISLPLQASSGSMKTVMSTPATVQNIYAPKSRTTVKKTFIKKRLLNLAMAKPKPAMSSQTDLRKNVNNNSSNVKNRNQKTSQPKIEKLQQQTSQSKPVVIDHRNDSLLDDPGEAKVKEEDTSVENEWKPK